MGASVGRLPPGFKPRNDRNLSRWHAVKGVPGYREVARGRFSARCCAFGTVRAQRRTRAKGGRTASVLAILREGSLPACAETGGCFASRCLKAPAPPAAGLFFDLPGLASFINLLFSTSQSRTGRAVFTVGQSREKRAFGRGDW